MASVKGVQNTLFTTVPPILPDSKIWAGNVKRYYDEYEASALEAGSTISTVVVPKGSRLHNIHVLADDLGTTTGTLEIGDSGDTDRFIAAYATGSATFRSMLTSGKIDNIFYEFPADTTILITTAGAAITGTIKIIVELVYE